MDFPIDIDFTPGKIQVHKDITVATRNAIIERGLKAGQRMPSAKEMAAQLGVSRTTMVKVYQQLAAEGLVETRIGSGTYIRNDGCPEQLHRSEPEMRNANILANLSKQALQLLKLSRSQSNASNALPISFHTAASDVLPVRQWQQILSRHCRLSDISNPAVDDESALESRHPFGHLPLRQALASFLTRVKALNCSADRIIVFEGTPQAFDFISTLLIDEDDLAIVEAPGRVAALNALVARKAKICKVATDENGLDTGKLDQIEQPCKLVYLSPSHAEQSGAVMSMRQEIASGLGRAG